jgi:hypothetical protein
VGRLQILEISTESVNSDGKVYFKFLNVKNMLCVYALELNSVAVCTAGSSCITTSQINMLTETMFTGCRFLFCETS